MTPKPISNWSIEESERDAFKPPELRGKHLVGDVEGRHGQVITSRIVKVEGRLVTTRTGSVYELGTPAPEYLAWLAAQGIAYDDAQPIAFPTAI